MSDGGINLLTSLPTKANREKLFFYLNLNWFILPDPQSKNYKLLVWSLLHEVQILCLLEEKF